MNRIKKDYCTKNHHPRWRAWSARYDTTEISWPWIGNFCTYCGARVDGVGSGSPDSRLVGKIKVLRAGSDSPVDIEKIRAREGRYILASTNLIKRMCV